MVKPSQWTAREAWSRAVKEVIDALGPTPSMVHAREWLQRCAFPFPADPPERVSDRELRTCGNGYALPTELQRLMALELIERRAKDKEAKG